MLPRPLPFAGIAAASAAVLLISACSSAGDSGSTATPSSASSSSSGSDDASPGGVPTDASAETVAEQFRCQVIDSTGQSSSADTTGGDIGFPVTESSVQCHRQAFDYDISSFDDTEGKDAAVDALRDTLEATGANFAYCDGGLWVVNVHIDGKPTDTDLDKLERGVDVAEENLGCQATMVGSNGSYGLS